MSKNGSEDGNSTAILLILTIRFNKLVCHNSTTSLTVQLSWGLPNFTNGQSGQSLMFLATKMNRNDERGTENVNVILYFGFLSGSQSSNSLRQTKHLAKSGWFSEPHQKNPAPAIYVEQFFKIRAYDFFKNLIDLLLTFSGVQLQSFKKGHCPLSRKVLRRFASNIIFVTSWTSRTSRPIISAILAI